MVGSSIPTLYRSSADRTRLLPSPRSSLLNPRAAFHYEVTFGEIRFGIEQLEDAGRRADIHLWLDRTLRPLFANRVLAITEHVIVRWKTMVVEGQRRGHTFGQPDLFIAAIAALEDLVVVTRDTGEFVAAGVPAFDPWASVLHAEGRGIPITAPASAEAIAEVLLGSRRDR